MQPRGDRLVGIYASRDNWRTCFDEIISEDEFKLVNIFPNMLNVAEVISK